MILFGHQSIRSEFDCNIVTTTYLHNSRKFGVIWENSIIPVLTKVYDIDILYCPNGNGPLFNLSIPTIMCIHDTGAQKGWLSGIHQLYRKFTLPIASKSCDHIVTVSKFAKSEIINTLNINREKIDIIYNGVDDIYLRDNGQQSIELPEKYILFVASTLELGTRKNIETVLKSFKKIKEMDFNHKLVLVGPENRTLFDNISDELEDDIIMTGFVSKPELKYAYKNARVFLFPTRHEGFGLPPLEAMACGTPVVASTSASLPEILNDAALLTEPDDVPSIVKNTCAILTDDELYREYKKRGLKRSQNFTWEKTKERLKIILINQISSN